MAAEQEAEFLAGTDKLSVLLRRSPDWGTDSVVDE
jgi:hypothetical protein